MALDYWTLKTFALLHDPPHKPLVLGADHAGIGQEMARRLCQAEPDQREARAIEEADRLAAGADRAEFLRDLSIDPRRELTLVHPLDASPLARERDGCLEFAEVQLTATDVDNARARAEGPDFIAPFAAVTDPRLRYLLLWRLWTDVLRAAEGQGQERLGALWDVLPADTRMPNHPLWVHDSLVACLAPILASGKRPALLRFSVGPVQPFIEAARTLADLWAGSWTLSRLVFDAMSVVFEELGPDSIVFPILRWQAFFDSWLAEQAREVPAELRALLNAAVEEATRRGLRTPSLPNLFVAVVPEDQGEAYATRCADKVRQALRSLVDRTVGDVWDRPDRDAALARARRQFDELVEVHYSVTPWPVADDPMTHLASAWPRPVAKRVEDARRTIQETLSGYRPNAGCLYPVVSEQSAVLLDAAKRERLRASGSEDGLKCSVCGEREVLGDGDFFAQRDLWRAMAQDRARFPWLRKNDALCGVCLTKRVLGRRGPEGASSWRHPSTSEVATSRAKLDVIRACAEDDRVRDAVVQLERAAEHLPDRDERRVFALPCVRQAAGDDGILSEFAHLDGDLLLESARSEEPLPREFEFARRKLLEAMRDRGLVRPSPYLAVVVFDGDRVGEWLSGAKAPSLVDMLHPRARARIPAERLAGIKRPVTPSIHGAISQICASFAQHAAPWTVEREGLPGHLVYAGGDDVLFLAPPLDAMRLVWRLRLRFSGHPWTMRPDEDPDGTGEVRPWFVTRDRRVVLAFGKDATASAGMCVFHARDPLGLAIERARLAEKAAKAAGRDALGVTVLRRSGQQSETVVPFGPAMRQLLDLARWFASHEVSRSLHALLWREFESLRPDAGGEAARLFELAVPLVSRVVDRRLLGERSDPAGLARLLIELGQALLQSIQVRGASGAGSKATPTGERLLRWWADAVSVAEFVARPFDAREVER